MMVMSPREGETESRGGKTQEIKWPLVFAPGDISLHYFNSSHK